MDYQRLVGVIENISTKIALTKDDLLGKTLDEYLPKLLNLLLVDNEQVRNKLIQSLSSIKRRLLSNEKIELEFEGILKLYLMENSFLKNFSKLFLDIAFQRNPKKNLLFEKIYSNLNKPDSILIGYLLEIIDQYKENLSEENLDILLDYFKDILLCTADYSLQKLIIPEGLSVKKLMNISNIKVDLKLKLKILNFLKEKELHPKKVFILFLIASCDQEDSVSSLGHDLGKKIKVEYDETLFKQLFQLYFGDLEVSKASEKLRIKIISQLLQYPESLKLQESIDVLNDCFFQENSSSKLKAIGIQYFLYLIEKTELIKDPNPIFMILFDNIMKIKSGTLSDETLKENYFLAFGVYAKKFPSLIDNNYIYLKIYFESFKNQNQRVRMSIQQGLSNLIYAYTKPSKEMEDMLIETILKQNDPYSSKSALECGNKIFPFNNISMRFLCLYCLSENNLKEEAFRGTDLESFLKYKQVSKSEENDYPQFDPFIEYLSKIPIQLNDTQRIGVLQFLSKLKNPTKFKEYISFMENNLSNHSHVLYEISSSLLNIYSEKNLQLMLPLKEKLFKFLFLGDEISREKLAKILSILYLGEKFDYHLKDHSESYIHGSLLLIGNSIHLYYEKNKSYPLHLQDSDLLDLVISLLDSHKQLIQWGAILVLGKYGRNSKHKKKVIDLLFKKYETTKDIHIQEKIVNSLGYLNDEDVSDDLIEKIFTTSQNPSEDFHFTVGEAISFLCGGSEYCSIHDEYSITFPTFYYTNESIFIKILKKIIENIFSTKKIIRFSASIWLLSILKYCSKSPFILKYINDIQKSFLILLSDSNQATQEMASTGCTILYEYFEDKKKSLLSSLCDHLQGKVSKDPLVLFPEKFSSNSSSDSLTRFKELLSIAIDIGQSEMIYRFLSLSNAHAIWNMRKASSFSVTIKQDKDSMNIPKIFKYQYNPNPMIAKIMKEMIKMIDPKKIDENLKPIMLELLTNMTNGDYKQRQACCLALIEVYNGKTFKDMANYINTTFEKLYLVMDDIHEASRLIAKQSCYRLGSFLIKSCDPLYTNDTKKALEIIIPIMIRGLLYSDETVRLFSLETVEKIIQISNYNIKPHISEIIITLLEQSSVLEPSQLNYLQNMIGSENYQVKEQIEKFKNELSQNNPIYHSIQLCEKYIDEDNIESLIPKLIELLRAGVGSATRQGTAKLLGNIIKFNGKHIKPYVKNILKISLTCMKSPSATNIEKSSLAKLVPDLISNGKVSDVKLLFSDIVEMYKNGNTISAHLTLLLINQALSVVKQFINLILPTIYIGKYDEIEQVAKVWNECWNEISFLTIEHRDLLIQQCDLFLEESNWKIKKQGSLGIKDLANIQDEKLLMVIVKHLKKAYFEGKENLIQSLEKYKDSKVVEIIFEESKKNNSNYKIQCLKSLKFIYQRGTDVKLDFKNYLIENFSKEIEIAKDYDEIRVLLIQLIPFMYQKDTFYYEFIENEIPKVKASNEHLEFIYSLKRMEKNEKGFKILQNYIQKDNYSSYIQSEASKVYEFIMMN